MKLHLSLLALVSVLFCCTPSARAGFWVKKQASVATIAGGRSVASPSTVSPVELLKRSVVSRPINGQDRAKDNSGWEGVVSLVSGLASILISSFVPPLLFLALPAIIFGILGLCGNKKNKGMAIAGLILGAVVILALALVVVAFSSGGL
jgi:hypothetical protein